MQGREHHFVPQFYLRGFSTNGRSLNSFNFARGLWIKQASIKHECSRRNLHSFAPGLEQHLKLLEDQASNVIRRVCQWRQPPPRDVAARLWLLTFVAFQRSRTPSAIRQVTAFSEYFRELLGDQAPSTDELDENPLALTLNTTAQVIPVAQDLEMHLIVNASGHEFITSDNPVVLHNQYCEGIKYRGVNGWACTGLQVFLPLSPSELLLLFDSGVYRVGRSQHGETATLVSNIDDVKAFNSLQIHNAEANVYFAGGADPQAIVQECNLLKDARGRSRFTFIETERVQQSPTHTSALIGHHENLLPVRLNTSVIAVRKGAKKVPTQNRDTYRKATGYEAPKPDSGAVQEKYPFKKITKKN